MIPIYSHYHKFPNKNLAGKYCLAPFIQVAIDIHGDVRLCGCESWLPTIIGNIFRSNIVEILSGTPAQTIRQSIINGSFEYCNENTCGIIRHGHLNEIDTLPPKVRWQVEDSARYVIPY